MVSRWDKTRNNLCTDYSTKETVAHPIDPDVIATKTATDQVFLKTLDSNLTRGSVDCAEDLSNTSPPYSLTVIGGAADKQQHGLQAMERKDTEKFYREELGWPETTFNCFYRNCLNETLETKGDPFRLWL